MKRRQDPPRPTGHESCCGYCQPLRDTRPTASPARCGVATAMVRPSQQLRATTPTPTYLGSNPFLCLWRVFFKASKRVGNIHTVKRVHGVSRLGNGVCEGGIGCTGHAGAGVRQTTSSLDCSFAVAKQKGQVLAGGVTEGLCFVSSWSPVNCSARTALQVDKPCAYCCELSSERDNLTTPAINSLSPPSSR